MGVSLILAVVPMLLVARVAPREKMKRIAIYTLIAAAPVGLWMLRNFLIVGSMTGERDKGFYSFDFIVDEVLRIAGGDWWFLGLTAPVLLALVMAACHGFHRLSDRKRDAAVASDVTWGPLCVSGGFALAYLTLLVAAMMLGGTWDGLQWRFLAPVYIPLLFVALLLMDGALRYARRMTPRGIVPRRQGVQAIGAEETFAAVLMLGLSLQAAWLVAQHGREIQAWNAGLRQYFAAPRWRNSESVHYIREAALTGTIWSNVLPVTSLYANGLVRHYRLSGEPDGLRYALLNAPRSGDVHVFYFNDQGWWSPYSWQQHEYLGNAVSRERLLELVAELADGKLYRLRERESWPAAIFHSSGAPVEGKSFGAFFNKYRGQRLPGEPWRWEKDGDADSWTSLPVQQSDYVYTPTAADVGHRLRASVYYTDHLGNRVKAITKPSEPVQPDILKMLASSGSEDGRGAVGASEADPIIRSRYDVYLRGNRLIYGNQRCVWEDEYGTRFPLVVYSLDSENGTPERDTLDLAWHRSSLNDNGICAIDRWLPDKDIVGIQTGQVDRYGNLLWEAERWFKEKRRWFDGYLSSATFGEPAARGVFDIYLGKGNLFFVKEPCGPEDAEHKFFVHPFPTDVNDLPYYRKRYGFDNLDFVFQSHDLREGGRCMAIRALPEYAIAKIRVGQYEGNSRLWTVEIPIP